MSAAEGRAWPARLSLFAIAVVLALLPWAFKLGDRRELGAPCGGGFDCSGLGARCVVGEEGRYCTRSCESDDDCPARAHCGIPAHDRWLVWYAASPLSERYCVPGPRPAEAPAFDPSVAGGETPGPAGAQFRPPEQRGGLGGPPGRASD